MSTLVGTTGHRGIRHWQALLCELIAESSWLRIGKPEPKACQYEHNFQAGAKAVRVRNYRFN
jgi:hypothetical protein